MFPTKPYQRIKFHDVVNETGVTWLAVDENGDVYRTVMDDEDNFLLIDSLTTETENSIESFRLCDSTDVAEMVACLAWLAERLGGKPRRPHVVK